LNELGLGVVFNGCIYNFRELRTELVVVKAINSFPGAHIPTVDVKAAVRFFSQTTAETVADKALLFAHPATG
jgi:hypothetical protein